MVRRADPSTNSAAPLTQSRNRLKASPLIFGSAEFSSFQAVLSASQVSEVSAVRTDRALERAVFRQDRIDEGLSRLNTR